MNSEVTFVNLKSGTLQIQQGWNRAGSSKHRLAHCPALALQIQQGWL
jgi:hypothetical protein